MSGAMNSKQQYLGLIAIFLLFISVFLAPWRVDYKFRSWSSGQILLSTIVYNPLFSVPALPPENFSPGASAALTLSGTQSVDGVALSPVSTLLWQPLLFTWTAIATAYAGLFFLLRKSK